MKKLILVRHVLTEDNELAKLSGHIDSKVSEEGKKQIEKITEFLKYEKIDRIYTTTSSRTKETVKNLANINSIEIQQSEDLQEISFGDFEGKDFKEIQKNYPDEFNKMIEQGYKYTYPNGESLIDCYERVSKALKIYKEKKDSIPRAVFLNVIKGNVGKVIAEEFISFVESDCSPLISYEDVFSCETLSSSVIEKVKSESHTRLYLSAMNILKTLELNFENDDISENNINRFIDFLKSYPVDLMVGIMKDMKNAYPESYKRALENETFVESYFESYSSIRG